MSDAIDSFKGDYRFLSNFWPARVEFDGVVYPTVEHAYVAAKTLDRDIRSQILVLETPGQVKRFGKKIELRPDWDNIKISVMRWLVKQKFDDPQLSKMLAETYPKKLIEGNTWGDTFWGVCKGVGCNHLGNILMSVRYQILFPSPFG